MGFRIFLVVVAGFLLAVILGMICIGIGEAVGVPHGILVLIFLVLLVGVPVALYYRLEKARDRRHKKAVQAEGFTCAEEPEEDLRSELKAFPTISMRAGGGLRNHFKTSRDGVELSIFDFIFAAVPDMPWWAWWLGFSFLPKGIVFTIQPRAQTVVLCRCSRMILPQFFLRLRRVISAEGTLEADLGEEVLMPPEFFKKYSLMGVDPESVREVFSPELVAHFLKRRNLHAAGMGNRLIVYRPGRLLSPKRVKPFVDEVVALTRLFEAAAARRANSERHLLSRESKRSQEKLVP